MNRNSITKRILCASLITTSVTLMNVGLPRAFSQDSDQPAQQPEVDPAAAEQAMQAAAAALEAAAQERAAMEAQQQAMQAMGDPNQGGPATQPAMQPEESIDTGPQSGGPTSRPFRQQQQQRNRTQFGRRTTTQPTANNRQLIKPVRTVTTEYALLLGRSIFKKGDQLVIDHGPGSKSPVTTAPSVANAPPERALIFNGVTESDSTTALVEDTNAHKVNKLHVGDAIAGGKVTRIDFDSLDYTVKDKIVKVSIGENFEGTVAAPTSGPAVFSASGGTSGGGGSGGGADSVLERMRQRRLQGK